MSDIYLVTRYNWCANPANRHPPVRGKAEGYRPRVSFGGGCDLWEAFDDLSG